MKNILLMLLSFATSFAFAQVRANPDGRLVRDTSVVVYNEQGKIVKYSEYKDLIASGEYKVVLTGDPMLPGTKSLLKKITEEDKQRRQNALNAVIPNTDVLRNNSQLDATPLAVALQRDLYSNKVILLVFSNPGCTACGDMFAQINGTIEEFGADSLVVIYITQNTEEKASDALKAQPLTNARIISRATSIKEFYGITALPAFVIADQNRTIRYNGYGIGPSRGIRVKNVINELRGLVPEGYYTLSYDQKHVILTSNAFNLQKENKLQEAAEAYESLFTWSLGKGMQQDYFYAALTWAQLGNADKAFHYLHKAVFLTKYLNLTTLNLYPEFSKMRSDPRWKAIIDQANLNFKQNINKSVQK